MVPVIGATGKSGSIPMSDSSQADEWQPIATAPCDDTFAMVRWRDILENTRLAKANPLLVAAVTHIGHYQIRNRGTVGGSLAHADPAA